MKLLSGSTHSFMQRPSSPISKQQQIPIGSIKLQYLSLDEMSRVKIWLHSVEDLHEKVEMRLMRWCFHPRQCSHKYWSGSVCIVVSKAPFGVFEVKSAQGYLVNLSSCIAEIYTVEIASTIGYHALQHLLFMSGTAAWIKDGPAITSKFNNRI